VIFAIRVILLFVIISTVSPVQADGVWTADIFGGSSYSFPTPLRIHQSGYDDIDITARYETKPFTSAPYYAWRIGKWQDGSAWEFEHVHQKLYLTNKPAEVQEFQITFGYSLFTLNRAWKYGDYIYRFGAGVVVTSPFSVVRGERYEQKGGLFDTGYHLSGATLQGAIGRRIYLAENLFIACEGKLTASYARVNIADGYAEVPNAAIHWLFGMGYDF
jgi:hypothetical protein